MQPNYFDVGCRRTHPFDPRVMVITTCWQGFYSDYACLGVSSSLKVIERVLTLRYSLTSVNPSTTWCIAKLLTAGATASVFELYSSIFLGVRYYACDSVFVDVCVLGIHCSSHNALHFTCDTVSSFSKKCELMTALYEFRWYTLLYDSIWCRGLWIRNGIISMAWQTVTSSFIVNTQSLKTRVNKAPNSYNGLLHFVGVLSIGLAR